MTTFAALLKRPAGRMASIILLSFLVYANTLSAPFQLDDKTIIVHNPIIKDLGNFAHPSRVRGSVDFFQYKEFKNRYVSLLSLALDYRVHALHVRGYHIVNLLIHTANALLVFFLVSLSFNTPFLRKAHAAGRSRNVAFVTALFFACHPVQTGAVTYIWQRVTLLAAFFCLLSLTAYVAWRLAATQLSGDDVTGGVRGGGIRLKGLFWYVVSLTSAVLAMKSKQTAFTLPVVIALYEFLFFEGPVRKRSIVLIPLLLTMLMVPMTQLSVDNVSGGISRQIGGIARDLSEIPRIDYLLTEFGVIMTYLRLLVMPIHQNLDYDYPISRSFLEPRVFLSFLFLSALFAAGVYLVRRSRTSARPDAHSLRLVAFGIFFFFITLSVESSVIPIADVIFEHRLYLPSAGFFLSVVAAVGMAVGRWGGGSRSVGRVVAGGTVIVIVLLSGAAYARNGVWGDSIRLWEDTVRKSPGKARPHNNLAVAYKEAGRIEDAIREYQIVLSKYPGFFMAHYDLGVAYKDEGNVEAARREFEQTVKLNPAYPEAHYDLANIYAEQGRIDEAVREYTAVLRIVPGSADAHNNLGSAYASQGRTGDAVREYRAALRISPENADIRFNLARAYGEEGLYREASEEYEKVLKIAPDDGEAHSNLGMMYEKERRFDEAAREYGAALKINPGDEKVRKKLADLPGRSGQTPPRAGTRERRQR